MSQLIVRPGRNAAREAKRVKEIQKVKTAIAWHERTRKKRQEVGHDRFEAKQVKLESQKWIRKNVTQVRKDALNQVKEDWKLGPLRPNRATGPDAATYGALGKGFTSQRAIPEHMVEHENENAAKKGLPPKYPLVVDGEKYFPIVKDDRVVVITGREKGKVGFVQELYRQRHEVVIKGVNMQYYDAKIFESTGEQSEPKRSNEVAIPIDHVRLVVPYQIIKDGQRTFTDVIVDNLVMERHTTGLDPFTGTDYGDAEIPKDHQYDPQTGLPIFHRYIAGTKQRIEWPWEREEALEDAEVAEEVNDSSQSWLSKTLNTLRHPISSAKTIMSKTTNPAPALQQEKTFDEQLEEVEQKDLLARKEEKPRSMQPYRPDAYETVDTTRDIVENAANMAYTLVEPPFPHTLAEELRGDIQKLAKDTKDTDGSKTRRVKSKPVSYPESEEAKARQAAAQQMKTPMQVRWELEQAKKLQQRKKSPLVQTDDLLLALGQHMQKAKQSKSNPRSPKAEELD